MNDTIRSVAIATFEQEAHAILALRSQLTDDFDQAVYGIMACGGKVITTGVGKAGIVGRKIAATLASTGTPAFFLHPTEAFHGDLGMISPNDMIVALSNSGESDELLKILPFIRNNGNKLVAMTGRSRSTLARSADYLLLTSVEREACPLNLAPTTSATAQMVMGDALAIALMKMRNFQSVDYARLHNGGSLGRRLLLRVGDVMRKDNLPLVAPNCDMITLIHTMSKAGLGLVVMSNNSSRIDGIITDGDIRRMMEKHLTEFFSLHASDIATPSPKTISSKATFSEAEAILSGFKITSLLVADTDNNLEGVIQIYDLIV